MQTDIYLLEQPFLVTVMSGPKEDPVSFDFPVGSVFNCPKDDCFRHAVQVALLAYRTEHEDLEQPCVVSVNQYEDDEWKLVDMVFLSLSDIDQINSVRAEREEDYWNDEAVN